MWLGYTLILNASLGQTAMLVINCFGLRSPLFLILLRETENFGNRIVAVFFAIARGSALECAAIQDVLRIGGALDETESVDAEKILVRIVSMLTKMARPEDLVREDSSSYLLNDEPLFTEDRD